MEQAAEGSSVDVEKSSDHCSAEGAFDRVVGCIEDIIVEDDFQEMQTAFLNKHCSQFDDAEENKLVYTDIFRQYNSEVEQFIEKELQRRLKKFSMSEFLSSLKSHGEELSGDVFDLLLTFSDFQAFKELMLSHKASMEGTAPDLSACLVVTHHQAPSTSERESS